MYKRQTGGGRSGSNNRGNEYEVRAAPTVVLDQNLMKGGRFNENRAEAAMASIESKLLDIISSGKKGEVNQVDADKASAAAKDYVESLKNGTEANTSRILQGSNTMINNKYLPIQDPFFVVNQAGEIELHYSLEQKGNQSTGTGSLDDI